MISHCGEGYTVGEVARVKSDELVDVIPKLDPRAVANAERHYDLVKSREVFDQGAFARFYAVNVKA